MRNIFITIVFVLLTITISAQKGVYAPTLINPSNDSTNVPPEFPLKWRPVAGAYFYNVQLVIDTLNSNNSYHEIKGEIIYTAKNLIFGKTYFWRVRSIGVNINTQLPKDTSAWSKYSKFTVINTVFQTLPADTLTPQQKIPVTIRWTKINGAYNYYYEVDVTPYFNTPLLIQDSNSITHKPPKPDVPPAVFVNLNNLSVGTIYYWRVKAGNLVSKSAWSNIWKFSTIFNLTDAPQLISPLDSAINQSPSPYLSWNPLQDAYTYMIQVDSSPSFNKAIIKKDITSTKYLFGSLKFGKTYYWRVKGLGANNISSWSVTRSFTVTEYPTLLEPIDGAKNQTTTNLVLKWAALAGKYECELDTSITFNPNHTTFKSFKGTTINATFTNLLKSTTYYWRVRAIYADTSKWSVFSFSTNDGHIASPVLLKPSDNAFNQPLTPTLSWKEITGATSYRIQVDENSDFPAKPLINTTANRGNYKISASTLLYKKLYYWRVKSKTTKDSSAWSDTFSFSTIGNMPDTPELYYPVYGAINQMPNSLLLWEQISGSAKYIVQIDTDSLFPNPDIDSSITVNQKNASNLKFGVKYFWRVKAKNATLSSDWSEVFSFIVLNNPNQISPADNAVSQPIIDMKVNWNKITGITGYQIQLAKTDTFNPSLIDVIVTDSFNICNSLKYDTKYYWRVRALGTLNTSEWSPVRNFTTIKTVRIISPVNNSIDQMPRLTLQFTSLSGATDYDYRIDSDLSFKTKDTIKGSTYGLTNFIINNLLFGKIYFIEVRGRNSIDTSDWSQPVKFTTINKFNAVLPLDGAINQMPIVELQWDNIIGNDVYNYEIDNSKLFNSRNKISRSSTYNLVKSDTLKFGTKYYWRVQSQGGTGDKSEWSDIRTFSTIDEVTPSKSPLYKFPSVSFYWQLITGIKNYEFQYDIDTAFPSPVISKPIATATGTTISGLKPQVNYYWRIRAISAVDTTQWNTFRIISGINNHLSDNSILDVFPIPCKNSFFVKYNPDKTEHLDYINLTLTNLLGQNLYSERVYTNNKLITKEIIVNKLQNGIYYLKVENGKNQSIRKIIIGK